MGARILGERCDALVVVDVLSFSTAVTVAVERGADVWPHPGGESAAALARDVGASLAEGRAAGGSSAGAGPSLSPGSLLGLGAGSRLVLPSPNGSAICSAISRAVGDGPRQVVAGCLRNAAAVARHLRGHSHLGLVPAGERWPDGSLRPAYEDLVGAGAVADRLEAQARGVELSPEAEAAALAFRSLRPLALCPSGIELVGRGWADDVRIASEIDATDVVPVLVEGRFVAG